MAEKVTYCRLIECLRYEPNTGLFSWRANVCNGKIKAGSRAGILENTGYVRISIDGRRYQAHTLAYLYMTGGWPSTKLDHRDLCRSNNQWHNIRPATNSQNAHNRRSLPTNTSGYRGVCFHKRKKLWQASITVNYKQVSLGYYINPIEAHEAYVRAAKQYYGEFARAA